MELTSPLTTLASISTPESYYTARGSPSNAADETSPSSPLEEHPPEEQRPCYRDAVQLPHELKSHCQIHLEEQLYSAAIHILSGLLSDGSRTEPRARLGAPTPSRRERPALVPPPSQLALLATLIIHPSFTSRPPETGNLHAAAHALAYLRGLLSTVGPVNANLRAAFEFKGSGSGWGRSYTAGRGHGGRGRGGEEERGGGGGGGGGSDGGSGGNGSDSDTDSVGGHFARDQLLFRRAPDFWAVLGWALRCAAEHPQRWRHWRVWLDYAVAVLEADWDERLARDHAAGCAGRGKPAAPYPALGHSLLVAYLDDLRRERKNELREVMRALFAFSDADPSSDRAVFREVFDRETVVGRGKKSKRKRADAVVDLENDQFGDYLDGDESESTGEGEETVEGSGGIDVPMPAAPRPRRKPGRKPRREESTPSFCLTEGIAESVPLRLRLFRLLSAASHYVPETFVPLHELYESFTTHVRGLPLPMFRLFVESHSSALPGAVRVSFLRMVIEDLLPPRRPDPADADPDNGAGHGVTVLMMQKRFLPFAASKVTAEDNAKLSLALESLLWFMHAQIGVEYSDALRRAVETGIQAREDRIRRRGAAAAAAAAAARADAQDKAAREALARSARSLRTLVDVIAAAGK